MGLAVYSPPLDDHGGSVRGLATAQRLSRDMELHFVRAARTGRSAILAAYDVTETPSGIRRNDEAADVLRAHGHRARVIELNGDLLFAGTESMVRELSGLDDDVELIVLDFRRTDQVSDVALRMLDVARAGLADAGRDLVLIEADGAVAESLGERHGQPDGARAVVRLPQRRRRILRKPAAGASTGTSCCCRDHVPVTDSPALAPLDEADALALQSLMTAKKYDDGDVIRRIGLRFGGVYFITSGKVSSTSPGPTSEPGQAQHPQRRHDIRRAGAGQRQPAGNDGQGGRPRGGDGAQCRGDLRPGSPPTRRLAIALWKALTRDAYTRVEQYLRESAVRIRG